MRHLVPKMSCPFWLVPIKSHKAPFLHRPPLWSKGDPGSRLLPPGGGGPLEAGHTGWGRGWGPPSLQVGLPPHPHPDVLRLHFPHLLNSLSNGREKIAKDKKVPEALKGFRRL